MTLDTTLFETLHVLQLLYELVTESRGESVPDELYRLLLTILELNRRTACCLVSRVN